MNSKDNDCILVRSVQYPNLPLFYLQVYLPQAASLLAERFHLISIGAWPYAFHPPDQNVYRRLCLRAFRAGFVWVDARWPLVDAIGHKYYKNVLSSSRARI